jgi:ribonuclease HII
MAALVGIDENGLGPRLGPLVVTGVLAEATPEGARWLRGDGAGAMSRIDDSKKLASFQRPEVAEAWARVLAPSADPDGLIEAVSLLDRRELRRLCPSAAVEAQCWSAPLSFEARPSLLDAVRGDLDELRGRGVELRAVKSVILCSERLHRQRAAGATLFDIDLHAMEQLLLALRERASTDIDAVCGKVGGLDRYLPRLGPLAGYPAVAEVEGRAASRYRVAGVGTVAFVRDADGSDLLVSLASLVGKYMREALMAKIADHYLAADPSLPRPSGYRDPVTGRFVDGTGPRRRLEQVPDRCFLRP